jgi:hypothetical protein
MAHSERAQLAFVEASGVPYLFELCEYEDDADAVPDAAAQALDALTAAPALALALRGERQGALLDLVTEGAAAATAHRLLCVLSHASEVRKQAAHLASLWS